MTSTRYDIMVNMVMRSLGMEDTAAFFPIVSSSSSTTTSDMLDRYLRQGARMHNSLHPRGFYWTRNMFVQATGVTNKITIDSSWNSGYIPEFYGFYDIRVRLTSSGDWGRMERIEHGEGRFQWGNLTDLPADTLPEYWSMANEDGVEYLYLWPYTIVDGDDIDLCLPYNRRILAIDGASNPDESMIWDEEDDEAVAFWTAAIVAWQMRDDRQYNRSARMGYMATRERLAAGRVYEIGMSLQEVLVAIENAEASF